MSAWKPRASSAGSTSAALASRPTLERAALALGGEAARDRVVEIDRPPRRGSASRSRRSIALAVDLDAQRDAAVHRHRQRLRAAHPAEPGGQRDRPGQRAAVAPPRDLGEALVGPLHDALAADVDPGAGRHLPVHRQPERLEAAELVPGGPLGHQVRVGDQHARGPLVGAEHADRLARLDEQRLVVGQRPQRARRSRRTPPTSAPRGRCRRRRRARRGARRRPGRGCSSASASRPPAASRGS